MNQKSGQEKTDKETSDVGEEKHEIESKVWKGSIGYKDVTL